MKTELVVIVRTYGDGEYRNNVVKLRIPEEAARIIKESWQKDDLPIGENVVSHYLSKNQSADCNLIFDGKCVGGISHMCSLDVNENERFTFESIDD